MFHLLDDSPRHLAQLVADREDALAYSDGTLQVGHPPVDANDALYAFEASQDYDPEPRLADIRARVQAINFEDDELSPAELGTLARLMPQVRHGSYRILPATAATHGHMTLIQAHLWKQHLAAVLTS